MARFIGLLTDFSLSSPRPRRAPRASPLRFLPDDVLGGGGEAAIQEMERLGLGGPGEIDLRLSLAETLHAAGRPEAARRALAETLPRLYKRAADIPEPAARTRYLADVPVNARVAALAATWLGEDALPRAPP